MKSEIFGVLFISLMMTSLSIVNALDVSFLESTATQDYNVKTGTFSAETFAKSYVESIEEPDFFEVQIKNYIKDNSEITELTIEAIIGTMEESPELLVELLESNAKTGTVKMSLSENTKSPFVDKVSEKVNKQLVREGKFGIANVGQESVGIQNRLINYLLNSFFTSPDINVRMITDSEDGLSINFIATSAGIFSTKIITDYETLGRVGEGRFTWPWKYGEFTAYFTGSRHSQGYHYIVVYPIIWKDVFGEDLSEWPTVILGLYIKGFVINVDDESSTIVVKPVVGNVVVVNPIEYNVTLESTIVPNVILTTGRAIQVKDYTIKPIKIEKPKFLKLIPIPWAKTQAKINISNGNKITTQVVKENSEFELGEIKVSVGEIKGNQVKFSMGE